MRGTVPAATCGAARKSVNWRSKRDRSCALDDGECLLAREEFACLITSSAAI
jgi:hypothetical protein